MKAASNHFFEIPHTKLGWWSVRLAITFVVMFIANVLVLSYADEALWRQTVLPFYAPVMLLSGLAGGIVGIIAILRWHEHSSFIWLSILLAVFVLLLVINELVQLMKFLQGQ